MTTFTSFMAAVGVGLLVAWPYQMLLRWVAPVLDMLNPVITIGFGVLLGLIGMAAVRSGHCRNRRLAWGLALPLAFVSLAASYWWDYQATLSQRLESEPKSTRDAVAKELPFSRHLEAKVENGWLVRARH